MDFIKKHLVFSVWVVLCLLVLLAGLWMSSRQSAKADAAGAQLQRATQEARSIGAGVFVDEGVAEAVFPSEENLQMLEERLEAYRRQLEEVRTELSPGTDILGRATVTEDNFLPRILSFVSRYAALARQNNVRLRENEAFGFSSFVITAQNPRPEHLPTIDKQRRILGYLLTQLYGSGPREVSLVRRQAVETQTMPEGQARTYLSRVRDVFQPDPAVSVGNTSEALETLAFEIRFRGDTAVLRSFLNRLARFEISVVVRQVTVRPVEIERRRTDGRRAQPDELLDFPMEGEVEEILDPSQIPVITQNESIFTVLIEYVEINASAATPVEAAQLDQPSLP